MFSVEEKKKIAEAVEKVLLEINHVEMPVKEPLFFLRVEGKESWSFAEIEPNWKYKENKPSVNQHNEMQIIYKKIRDILVDQLDIEPEKIFMDSSPIKDFGADSLDAIELIVSIEEEFDFKIPNEDAEKIKTVKDMVDYVQARTN